MLVTYHVECRCTLYTHLHVNRLLSLVLSWYDLRIRMCTMHAFWFIGFRLLGPLSFALDSSELIYSD